MEEMDQITIVELRDFLLKSRGITDKETRVEDNTDRLGCALMHLNMFLGIVEHHREYAELKKRKKK